MTDEPTKDAGKPRSEKTPVFRFIAFLVLPLMHVLARYRLHGVENVPTRGAFVLAPNHYSEIDPLVMGVAMWKVNRMPRFLAKASIFKLPFLGMLMRKSGQVPVERSGVSRGSDPLAAARQIVENELAVVIYPEGTLTRDPDMWPMRGKTGAVRMALEAGIPIVPAVHWGTQLVMPRYSKKLSVFPRKTIDVLFGPPVDLSAFAGKPLNAETLTQATTVLMDAMTVLLEQLRGEAAPEHRWDPSKHNQKETGRFDN
ncbi:MAG: lysophospholipid acyltransferase family protein [Microbacteriaceae bacterium]